MARAKSILPRRVSGRRRAAAMPELVALTAVETPSPGRRV
jgi:hypothetical protein